MKMIRIFILLILFTLPAAGQVYPYFPPPNMTWDGVGVLGISVTAATVKAGGPATATSAGVSLTVAGGSGGATSGNGGALTLNSGAGTEGDGGAIAIVSANGTTGTGANRRAGNINITSGNGTGTRAGGAINVTGGTGGVTGAGGSISYAGGAGGATSGAGGQLSFAGGASSTASAGGNLTFTGGASTSGVGGTLTLTAGAGSTTANGGQVILQSSAGANTLVVDQFGNIICSCNASASATDGFSYLGAVTAVPTGTPAHTTGAYANSIPTRYDTADSRLYSYNGAWINVADRTVAPLNGGTTFTLGSGTGACATTSTLTGGSVNGSFLCTGTAGTSTQIVNLPTATNGWACWANDDTSNVAWSAGSTSTTAITLKGTIATTSDKVVFGCSGF